MKPIYIEATDIPDAWFQCVSSILINGFKYEIQQGSFVGQTRLEFDFVTVQIKHPYQEPYDLMLPQIPQHLNIPNPVANGYVEDYLPYLMTSNKEEQEDYTYGERLIKVFHDASNAIFYPADSFSQIEYFINLLKKTPNTNQAILQVAQPSDCLLGDPPCLRHIDMRIKKSNQEYIDREIINGNSKWFEIPNPAQLIFYPYFRSWDLWGGFPANLAGIAVLQKYMADSIGVEVGPMIASSKGLHIYGYVEELAKIRCAKGA